jgi:type VI protein secretion system component VasF
MDRDAPGLHLTRASWPTFFFLIRFLQQARAKQPLDYEQVRREALVALRDGAEIAAQDSLADRAWSERIRRMLIYVIDYHLAQADWAGRLTWRDHRLETSPEGLREPQALGGDRFFDDCDELQKQYEASEGRGRDDRDILAEQLSLYFTAIRLGFKGRYHGFDADLDEYARRLYQALPEQRSLKDDPMFPQAYAHTIRKPAVYALGVSIARIASVFVVTLLAVVIGYQVAWRIAIRDIRTAAETYESPPAASQPAQALRSAPSAPPATMFPFAEQRNRKESA